MDLPCVNGSCVHSEVPALLKQGPCRAVLKEQCRPSAGHAPRRSGRGRGRTGRCAGQRLYPGAASRSAANGGQRAAEERTMSSGRAAEERTMSSDRAAEEQWKSSGRTSGGIAVHGLQKATGKGSGEGTVCTDRGKAGDNARPGRTTVRTWFQDRRAAASRSPAPAPTALRDPPWETVPPPSQFARLSFC